MNNKQVWEKLTEVFRSFFSAPDIVIRPETTAADIAAWDSLSHVQLVLAVESAFGIRFDLVEIASFENVGAMADSISAHLAKAN
jgi:acyl carrier protein